MDSPVVDWLTPVILLRHIQTVGLPFSIFNKRNVSFETFISSIHDRRHQWTTILRACQFDFVDHLPAHSTLQLLTVRQTLLLLADFNIPSCRKNHQQWITPTDSNNSCICTLGIGFLIDSTHFSSCFCFSGFPQPTYSIKRIPSKTRSLVGCKHLVVFELARLPGS